MQSSPGFPRLLGAVAACHIATYFVCGVLAFFVLDYRTYMQTGPLAALMMPMDSPWVAAGPALQIFRCVLFAAALLPLRGLVFGQERGWLILWSIFLAFAIFGTAGPSPGSLEGMIYTRLSVLEHLRGLPEVLLQTLAFSWLLAAWIRRERKWVKVTTTTVAALAVVFSVLGAVMARSGAAMAGR